jgi:predicted membrane protein
MDSKIIIGLLIIFFGISMIINQVFKIDFPFFRLLIGLMVIYFGLKILLGSFNIHINNQDKNSSVFKNQTIAPQKVSKKEEYTAIFGNSVIDLREAEFENGEFKLEVNGIFGSVKILLPQNAQIQIKSSSVFGSVKTPDGGQTAFGDKNESFGDIAAPVHVKLEANAVFGYVEISY